MKSSSVALLSVAIVYIVCNVPRLMLNDAEFKLRSALGDFNNFLTFFKSIFISLDQGFETLCETQAEVNRLSALLSLSQFCLLINSSVNILVYYSIQNMIR